MQAGAHDCDYNKQFDEKRCRLLLNLANIPACGGAVALHYDWGNPPREAICGAAQGNLVLWSIGAPRALPVRLVQGCRKSATSECVSAQRLPTQSIDAAGRGQWYTCAVTTCSLVTLRRMTSV